MISRDSYIGSPDNPRTAAIIAYITIIGWLMAYYWLYPGHKSRMGILHIRQALFLHIFTFIINVIMYYLVTSLIVYGVVVVALFTLWAVGVMHAINGQEKLLPVIGPWSQKLFAGLKA